MTKKLLGLRKLTYTCRLQKNLDSNPLESITIETSIRRKDNDDSSREFCVPDLDEFLLESDNDENTISILN